jgi:hypothetical protein
VSLLLRLACSDARVLAVQLKVLWMLESLIHDLFQSSIVDIGQITIPKETQRAVEQDPKGDRDHSKITETKRK